MPATTVDSESTARQGLPPFGDQFKLPARAYHRDNSDDDDDDDDDEPEVEEDEAARLAKKRAAFSRGRNDQDPIDDGDTVFLPHPALHNTGKCYESQPLSV